MVFQMLLRILALSECFYRNVNSSPTSFGNWIEETELGLKANPETVEELAGDRDDIVVRGDEIMDEEKNAVDSIWTEVDMDRRISVPYVISPDLTSRADDIRSAMDMISQKTCVSFRAKVHEPDYLQFKLHHGCASYVGRIGGPQTLYVGPYCHKGNICHEILHALGFHHEQTRPDNGKYIKILFDNIMSGKERNFHEIHGNTLELNYDPNSIMHYGCNYFSTNGSPTIVGVSGEEECPHDMGQRDHMTELDFTKVRMLYKCDANNQVAGR